MADISKWIVLILVISAVVFVIKAGMKIINVLIMILVLGFAWFSFFTEEGAARLGIALNGHPVVGYTTKLDKQESLSSGGTTYYKSSKDVIINGKTVEYIKCYTKWIIRIPSVGEY